MNIHIDNGTGAIVAAFVNGVAIIIVMIVQHSYQMHATHEGTRASNAAEKAADTFNVKLEESMNELKIIKASTSENSAILSDNSIKRN
jgi:hypothetical protein